MIPEYGSKKFQCPHCNTVATQQWFTATNAGDTAMKIVNHLYFDNRPKMDDWVQERIENFLNGIDRTFKNEIYKFIPKGFATATCSSCDDFTLWVRQQIVFPKKTPVSKPNEDMSQEIQNLYLEASKIVADSPRGATALLRLALQLLLKQLGKTGNNINNDIKELVQDGLSPKIQKALDLVRVVGNNAVHPGQIDLDDGRDIALKMFHILNFIADEMISKPKELDFLYSDIVPDHTQEHIKERDGK